MGKAHFEELVPQNDQQKERWEKKRQEEYAISVRCFLRAFYKGQLLENGFLLVEKVSAGIMSEGGSPVLREDILQIDEDRFVVTIRKPLFLICYGKPVTDRMIKNSRGIQLNSALAKVVELPSQQFMIFPDGTCIRPLETRLLESKAARMSTQLPVDYGIELDEDL